MKNPFNKKNTKGFTIVELMIATTVFSVVLLLTSAGVIAIGRAYYKSLTSTRVQEAARSVMDDISRSLQFAGNESATRFVDPNPGDGVFDGLGALCFGTDRYTYRLNQKVEGSTNGLFRDTKPPEGCVPSTCFDGDKSTCSDGRELLGNNMRLLQFDVLISLLEEGDVWSQDSRVLKIKIAYGDNDLLSHYDDTGGTQISSDLNAVQCKGGTGSNFCAVSQLETSVTSRVE